MTKNYTTQLVLALILIIFSPSCSGEEDLPQEDTAETEQTVTTTNDPENEEEEQEEETQDGSGEEEETDTTDEQGSQKDQIEEILTTSRENYSNAQDGDWIEITEGEYNSLASGLLQVSKSGTTDVEYDTDSNIITTTSSPTTLVNQTTDATIAIDSYLFAFKYYATQATDQPGLKVKLSSKTNTEGFADVGNPLPRHTATNQEVYFVLKGNNVTTSDIGYIGIFKPAGLTIGRKQSINQETYYYALGDTETSNEVTSTPLKLMYQGLSTTTKQW